MGSDVGTEPIIGGGIQAAEKLGDGAEVILVGDRVTIERRLEALDNVPGTVSTRHAGQAVTMGMAATEGARMKDSSISIGLSLMKNGEGDAFVSPGNTGAVMATALLTLGRIKGVIRPAIASIFPTSVGKPCVVLDVGANSDCKPQHLFQFAVMGSVYASLIQQTRNPRVGLLSIGHERTKGNELIFAAHDLLEGSDINFVGNIEGRDILSGKVDVAVTEGFTGNILLKFAESIQPMLASAIKRQIDTNIFSRFGVMMMLPFVRRMRNTFDYAREGGAPLLGVDGNVIICHGSSSSRAISNAIVAAFHMAKRHMKERLQKELLTNHFGNNDDAKEKSEDFGDGVLCSGPSDD
jgi:glycerol-3-phosphate acyltransferase PlsX